MTELIIYLFQIIQIKQVQCQWEILLAQRIYGCLKSSPVQQPRQVILTGLILQLPLPLHECGHPQKAGNTPLKAAPGMGLTDISIRIQFNFG